MHFLAGTALNWLFDLAKDKGEELVVKGVKKVTGIDLTDKKKISDLTDQELTSLHINKIEIEKLDFEKLKEENRHKEANQKEITQRWESDNRTGGINAKVRPYTLIYLMAVISIFAIFDGNFGQFAIKKEWVSLFTNLAITAFGGYFVLRTYEKSKGNK
jgi:hypothetical protein